MTVAASLDHTRAYPVRLGSGPYWARLSILLGMMTADLVCFAVADQLLHAFAQPPAIALFRNQALGRPNSLIDLVMIIAIIFVGARYLVGDYSRRQLFWDGARATSKALLVSGVAYTAAVSLLAPQGAVASALVWLGMLFAVPTARQGMRLVLGKMGIWHLPTAIIGTSPMAQEVVPVLGAQLALGLKVRWVVPETPETQLSDAFSGLTPLIVPQDQLAPSLVAAGCRQVILVPDDRTNANPNDLIDLLVGADMPWPSCHRCAGCRFT